jgi:hypothetical protein
MEGKRKNGFYPYSYYRPVARLWSVNANIVSYRRPRNAVALVSTNDHGE